MDNKEGIMPENPESHGGDNTNLSTVKGVQQDAATVATGILGRSSATAPTQAVAPNVMQEIIKDAGMLANVSLDEHASPNGRGGCQILFGPNIHPYPALNIYGHKIADIEGLIYEGVLCGQKLQDAKARGVHEFIIIEPFKIISTFREKHMGKRRFFGLLPGNELPDTYGTRDVGLDEIMSTNINPSKKMYLFRYNTSDNKENPSYIAPSTRSATSTRFGGYLNLGVLLTEKNALRLIDMIGQNPGVIREFVDQVMTSDALKIPSDIWHNGGGLRNGVHSYPPRPPYAAWRKKDGFSKMYIAINGQEGQIVDVPETD